MQLLPRGDCGVEVELRFGEIGFDAESLFAMSDRLAESGCALENEAQVALSAGIGRQTFERLRIPAAGLFKVAAQFP
jgi:hypothetical protein